MVLAIFIRIIFFNYEDGILVIVDSCISIATLIFGLIYAVSGYKKKAARFYQVFMGMYSLSSIVSLVTLMQYFIKNNLVISANCILDILCLALLVYSSYKLCFSLDLGYKKSKMFALIILDSNLIKMIVDAIFGLPMSLPINFSNLIFACLLMIFVLGKYVEKENRGTK